MFRAENNRSGADYFDVTFSAEVDEYPFIAISVETEGGGLVAEMIITSPEEAEVFAQEANAALATFRQQYAQRNV